MLIPVEMNTSSDLVDNDWVHEADGDTFYNTLDSLDSVNEEMVIDNSEYYDRDAWVGNRDVLTDFYA